MPRFRGFHKLDLRLYNCRSNNVLRRLGISPAPQYRAMRTLAPMPIPIDMNWNRLWI